MGLLQSLRYLRDSRVSRAGRKLSEEPEADSDCRWGLMVLRPTGAVAQHASLPCKAGKAKSGLGRSNFKKQ